MRRPTSYRALERRRAGLEGDAGLQAAIVRGANRALALRPPRRPPPSVDQEERGVLKCMTGRCLATISPLWIAMLSVGSTTMN